MHCTSDAVVLMLSLAAALSPPPPGTDDDKATFQTKRNLPELEQCLTKNLSKRGDVTTFNADGVVTVMLRTGTDPPLLIDLDPPSVTVTTRMLHGTRQLIRSCV